MVSRGTGGRRSPPRRRGGRTEPKTCPWGGTAAATGPQSGGDGGQGASIATGCRYRRLRVGGEAKQSRQWPPRRQRRQQRRQQKSRPLPHRRDHAQRLPEKRTKIMPGTIQTSMTPLMTPTQQTEARRAPRQPWHRYNIPSRFAGARLARLSAGRPAAGSAAHPHLAGDTHPRRPRPPAYSLAAAARQE